MNKSNLAECQCFPHGKLSLSFGCVHDYLSLCIMVSRWNCLVVGSQFILCYGFCWINYLNLFWLNVMVAINELCFMIMIMLSNMLLYSGVILMCTIISLRPTFVLAILGGLLCCCLFMSLSGWPG
jgi:hypothetical protein